MEAILDATEPWLEPDPASGRPATRVCAAVSCGDIIFGAVGSGARPGYTVIGSAVNKAAKLEKHTKAETCAASSTGRLTTVLFRKDSSHRPDSEPSGPHRSGNRWNRGRSRPSVTSKRRSLRGSHA